MTDEMTGGSAVEARRLTKRYGDFRALSDVSFDVAAGAAVALWGPNGAGKTTIMRCLLGLSRFEGSVRIGGIDPVADGRAARALIGYVPQDLPIQPLTVGEMAAYVARLKHAPAKSAIERLATLGIAEQANKEVAALSGGMRQRLSLALALIGTPKVLLLDEPTANLDARGRAELLNLLRGLKQAGMTLIFSSHRPEDVLALADRVMALDAGVLEQEQTPARFADALGSQSRLVVSLRNGHRHVAVETLNQMGLVVDGEGRVLTVAIRHDQKADVLSALARDGVDIEDFDVERMVWTQQS